MRPLILIDLDDVLINNRQIKKDLFEAAGECGATREEVLLTYAKARTWPFAPNTFADALWSSHTTRARAKKAFAKLFQTPGAYTYPGVHEFLKILKSKCQLVLLTYGTNFQKTKLLQSGLSSYFSKAILTKDSTKEKDLRGIKKQYKGSIVLLDDMLTVCAVAEELGIPAIRVKKTPKDKSYYNALLGHIGNLLEKQA